MSISSCPSSAFRAPRLALAVAAVIGILLLWLTLRPSPENLAAPSKGDETRSAVPEELTALGDDPDGDGISTADELRNGTNPLVADFPDVQILVEDIEFGLRVSATRSSSEKKLTAEISERQNSWHNAWTSGLEMSQTESKSMTAYTGRGGISVANYAVPFGYVGQHVERSVSETTRSHSSFSFKREQLNTLKQQVQHQRENSQEARIEPNAGYFHGRVTVVSSHACCLEDFSVNVKVNGRLRGNPRADPWLSRPAASASNFIGQSRPMTAA